MIYLRVHTSVERYYKPFDSLQELYEYLIKNGFSYEYVFEGVNGIPNLHPTWKSGLFTYSEYPMMKAFIVDSAMGDDIPILVNKQAKK